MFTSSLRSLTHGRLGATPSRVVEQLRADGPLTPRQLVDRTGDAPAVVARSVAALVEAGVVRSRADLDGFGAGGPPVELDPDQRVVVGVHLGRRDSTVGIGDLAGRLLGHRTVPTKAADGPDLVRLGALARALIAERGDPRALAAGLIAPWRDVGLDPGQTGVQLNDVLGLDVAVADHIPAMAAADFAHHRYPTPGSTLYVYARNTVGFAVAVDRGARIGRGSGRRHTISTDIASFDSLTHLPTGSDVRCGCGRTGCLEATVADDAVVARAGAGGVLLRTGPRERDLRPPRSIPEVVAAASAGEPVARMLLTARARALGRAAATVRDRARPDRVVLVGQGFTDYADGLETVVSAFWETSGAGAVDLSFSRFGADVQAVSACTIALGPVYDDPLGLVHALPPAPASDRPARRAASVTG